MLRPCVRQPVGVQSRSQITDPIPVQVRGVGQWARLVRGFSSGAQALQDHPVQSAHGRVLSFLHSHFLVVHMQGLDIGPDSCAAFAAALKPCKTILWNGPMGVSCFLSTANSSCAHAGAGHWARLVRGLRGGAQALQDHPVEWAHGCV